MKNHKQKLLIILLLSCVLFLLALVLLNPLSFGICKSTYTWDPTGNGTSEIGCLDNDSTGQALAMFSVLLILFSIILLFRPEQIFQSWKKFAMWWLPLSAFLVFVMPSTGGSGGFGGGGLGGPDREIMTWFTAGVFFLVSLAIIVRKSLKLRGK